MLCVNDIQIAQALALLKSKPARRMPYGSTMLVLSFNQIHGAKKSEIAEPAANAAMLIAPPKGLPLNEAMMSAE